MKKITTLLLAILLILCAFAGCSQGDKSDLVTYTSDTGITIDMKEGFTEEELEGVTCYFQNSDCILSGRQESFTDLATIGFDGKTDDMKKYADLVKTANGLSEDFLTDDDGNYFITYEKDIDGTPFFYYTTLRKGSSSCWVISLACLSEDKDAFMPQFETWAKTIVLE